MNTNTNEYNNSILKKIEQTINETMELLAKDNSNNTLKDKINTLRLTKTELIRENERKYTNVEYKMNENDETKVLLKMINDHKESIKGYEKTNNPTMAEKETNELNIIQKVTPKQPTIEEIENYTRQLVQELIAENNNNYIPSMKDMGKVMPKVKAKYPNADGNVVRKILLGQ